MKVEIDAFAEEIRRLSLAVATLADGAKKRDARLEALEDADRTHVIIDPRISELRGDVAALARRLEPLENAELEKRLDELAELVKLDGQALKQLAEISQLAVQRVKELNQRFEERTIELAELLAKTMERVGALESRAPPPPGGARLRLVSSCDICRAPFDPPKLWSHGLSFVVCGKCAKSV